MDTKPGRTSLEEAVLQRCADANVFLATVEEEPDGRVYCTRPNESCITFMNDLRRADLQIRGYVQSRDAHVWVTPNPPRTW